MAKKIVNLLVLLPIGIILIIFCVANRQLVTMAFNPFRPEDQVLSLSAPLFVFLFVTLILGMVIGSAATWFTQGRYRKRARTEAREAVRWQAEADRHRNRAEQIAGHLPAK
ncbi:MULTISPECIES: LapA family protein [Rhizobium]|uniref:LapA family protein n=1 Tax=Rhizobium rhododendri TaxID=2506430 RepID=A0ABY8II09_9HYPH|nr:MULTISPECIES: LapA family protein [Rhizobium]MBZ5759810.1 LapA family protein [Rhizobium sp. VS19-DR96]MBZ5766198.1 LapA family protein [Rhizobium sp. VS19-DR129.2]MBZ5772981.1 LapA family protein [Rhizobium sp. VS19-DRK62.2]MBZ5783965.1 LapA family protein [Rhizobium sp. VS19-DR121]MBZ5803542.1 LapA family protein [Rhizobium sp. VS19-DR181]